MFFFFSFFFGKGGFWDFCRFVFANITAPTPSPKERHGRSCFGLAPRRKSTQIKSRMMKNLIQLLDHSLISTGDASTLRGGADPVMKMTQ